MSLQAVAWFGGFVMVSGCVAQYESTDDEVSSQIAAGAAAQSIYTPCATATGETGWSSAFVPQQYGAVQEFGFFAYPGEPSRGPIDMVFGLSNGPASSFSQLGPIVRFNSAGFIDVRDGDVYRADTAMPYLTDELTSYLVQMTLDYSTQTYSAVVYENYSPAVTLATNYHFRTEQSAMTRADNFVTKVDSATGAVRTCYPGGSTNYKVSSAGSGWTTTPLLPRSGLVHIELETEPEDANLDAVVGLAAAAPTAFRDLAAIARFSPAGVIEARDGDVYRADASFPYARYQTYRFVYDVDVTAHTYSLVVEQFERDPVVIARDYAFRTEQLGVASIGAVGQFVDGTAGSFFTGRLLETY